MWPECPQLRQSLCETRKKRLENCRMLTTMELQTRSALTVIANQPLMAIRNRRRILSCDWGVTQIQPGECWKYSHIVGILGSKFLDPFVRGIDWQAQEMNVKEIKRELGQDQSFEIRNVVSMEDLNH
ncbi:hypothetical protein T4B_7595 [Trichinella pseudospiralis]|uniref:Uncharacterized protein n=1 Tax=Trichinella pseudospiralis TaxID=6337 RepID=A0A0V1EZV1_TRIPS|nr:hypothetical protein T4A_5523 [Trichinella pseudospiralis]KRZ32473.1 hypothetical protein T4B_7595 [Trichinella pseudospiralis]KRZ45640.1 hypothetical protein T4C_5534 [Trichinella pseudospiralis]